MHENNTASPAPHPSEQARALFNAALPLRTPPADETPEQVQEDPYGEYIIASFSANLLFGLVVLVFYVNFVLIRPYLSPLLWAFFFSFALKGSQRQVKAWVHCALADSPPNNVRVYCH